MSTLKLKADIKDLVVKQIVAKSNRKESFTGERTLTPSQAAANHIHQRRMLRILYMAYGLMRGRTQEQVESNPVEPINMDLVDRIITKYTRDEVVTEKD